jgi:hypothetical protein
MAEQRYQRRAFNGRLREVKCGDGAVHLAEPRGDRRYIGRIAVLASV